MRLVDADEAFVYLVKCKELKESEAFKGGIMFDHGVAEGYEKSAIIIRSMPTIDAVPVVRCKDCKYHIHGVYEGSICDLSNLHVKDGDYCSKAKEGEYNETY